MTRTPLRLLVRSLLVLATATAVVFAATQRSAVADAVRECTELDRTALLLAVVLTLLGVLNRGLQTRRSYAGAGVQIDTATATALTATAYSGNKVTKSGGLVGLAVHLQDARRCGLDPTRTVAAYVVITLSGMAGVFALAIIVLALSGLPSLVATFVALVVLVCLATRRRARAPAVALAGHARRVAGRFSGSVDVDDVGDACRSIARARDQLQWVLCHAVVGKLLGALTLQVVLQGFGVTDLGVETTVRLYALSLAAAALGPLPAGFGTTEASLAGMLVAADVDGGTALAAAMAFRMFDLWLPVAIGAMTAPFVLRRPKADAPAPEIDSAATVPLPALETAAAG